MSRVMWSLLLVTPVSGAVLLPLEAIATPDQPTLATEDFVTEAASPIEAASVTEAATEVVEMPEVEEFQVLSQLPDASTQPPQTSGSETSSQDIVDADTNSLEQIVEYSSENNGDRLDQVTSISQLSDVQPTDWAFQALQSLVERYGVIAGYPDGTYRGNRALTRYEFAAGLNAALDRVNELIAAGLAEAVTQEDLATLQRLQEEFAAELATLRGRVDSLEARTAELEANQFSTTTRLQGRVQFLVSNVFDEDNRFDDQTIFVNRVRLNFDTSFTGEDRLRTRLQARNIPQFEGDPVGFQAAGSDSDNSFVLDDLTYSFPVGERIEVLIGANGLDIDDLTEGIISPLGESSDSGAISEFADPRQYEQGFAGTGAGAGLVFRLIDNDSFSLGISGGYVGDEPEDPAAGNGLFNGDYSAIGQITFLSDFVDLALTYVNAYDDSGFGDIYGAGEFYDIAAISDASVANTYGAQVNFKLGDTFEIGGGIAYTDVSGLGGRPDYELWSYQATLAINDLGGEGNQLGILAGIPTYTADLREFGAEDDNAFLAEVYYRYTLSDNIALTPSVIYIVNPFNNQDVDDTFIGTLRTTFSF
ncbi:MAG: iron uptake porin [Leptolyngbyaceae cyanobacterium RM2_2_4]|nr:iron uptake porin [Leptolyngbyaceae cyanobacterium SM1_4_3]NJO50571.1 iron uptake porin [Leptolyngbyaceae cyanobacterium RM2_2_4]